MIHNVYMLHDDNMFVTLYDEIIDDILFKQSVMMPKKTSDEQLKYHITNCHIF